MTSLTVKPINLMPRVQRKPYTPEKQKRGKAMTVGVGFLCNNGNDFILAIDRQITAPGAYKIRRKKYSTDTRGFVDVAFLYSGEPGTFSAFTQKVEAFLDAQPNITLEIIQGAIEKTVDSMKLRDSFDARLWLLVGVCELLTAPWLIVFDSKEVFRSSGGVQIIGAGDTSLIHYLSERLHRPDMTTSQGVALGGYLIKKATQYVDGCGEPIDVIHGNRQNIQVIPNDKVSTGIRAIEDQEDLLFTLMVQTPSRS
jgi:hypothetical protein